MKRTVMIVALILLAVVVMACSKSNEIKKKAGDLDVSIVMDKNPPVTGSNEVTIRIADPSGKPVTGARVKYSYSMPAMAGMPAMDYSANAVPQGNAYRATVNYSMPGSWNNELTIVTDQTRSVRFTIDVK
ncbi:MAG: copper resistance protein [Deltaproteobacteria bacterium]|nr:copper resistance protein [Deltaproteobacteria bacterium]